MHLQCIIKDCEEDKQITLFFSCGRARAKTEGKKSKYTEWERGDKSWDSLLIWFPSNSGKQHTAEWINFLITLCLMSVRSCWRLPLAALCHLYCLPSSTCSARSHPKDLSPLTALALLHGGVWGDRDFVSLHHSAFPWLENQAGETHLLPQLVCYRRGRETFSPPNSDVPWETLAQGRGHRWDLGEQDRSELQAKPWGEDKVLLLSPLTESLGNHIIAYCYNHW